MRKPNYTVAQWLRQREFMPREFKRTLRTGVVVAFMFTAVTAHSTSVDRYQSQIMQEHPFVMTLPTTFASEHIKAIEKVAALEANWDGEGAVAPNADALKNSKKLLSLLDDSQLQLLPPSNIYASSYGSIVLDFETPRGLVSVEMGDVTMGFYTDFPDGDNYATEGISTNFNHVPQILETYLS